LNPYGFIAALVLLGAVASWGVWERGTAEHWHEQYSSLQASYQTAALKAESDAKAQEAKAAAENQERANKAVTQAYAAQTHAEAVKAQYNAKLAALAKSKPTDLPHICANVPKPPELP